MLFLAVLPWAGATARDSGGAEPDWEMALWRDPSGQADLAQVSRPAGQALFAPWDRRLGEVNLAYTPDALWVRVKIHKPAGLPPLWVLEVPFHGLQTLDIHLPGGRSVATGLARPMAEQQLQHRFPALALELEDGPNVLYLRATSNSPLTVPLRIWLPRDFLAHVQASTMVQALYFGGLGVMLVYNLFLAISLRDRRFASYALFAAALFAAMLSGNGYGRMLLWPQSGGFDGIAQSFFLCLGAGFSIEFSRQFLRLKATQPRINQILKGGTVTMLTLALLLLAALTFSLDPQPLHQVMALVVLPLGVLIMVAALRSLLRGIPGIRFFVLAWCVLWMGAFVATFRVLGWLPSNTFTMYALQIASAGEMLLLALALADIVHQERAQRDQAQAMSLQLQEQMLQQLRQSEDRLDLAVKERTQQLEIALTRQREVLDQYVRFGALISHEFRNPLGIIQSQVSLVRKLLGEGRMEPRLESIMGATRRLSHLFDRWLQGGRLHQLGDELRVEPLNLWPWLQDLLTSYPQYTEQHRLLLEPAACAETQAWVLVDEALLESAVINLMDNACKYSPPGTQVRLFLQKRPGQVGLAVQDQGPGIPAALQDRIFDEYMRAHPEGPIRGLGLGLALVKRIAELLQGSIELQSSSETGSCFCLWLAEHPTPTSS